MQRLGGEVVTADGIQFSSLYKGESIEDTIVVAGQYCDIIAMRHPEVGSADRAAAVSPVPSLTPVMALGSIPRRRYWISSPSKRMQKIDGLKVAMVGDLRYGRTVHSLSFLLGLYDNIELTFVSPKELTMPEKVTSFCKEKNITFSEASDLEAALDSDVLYMTRIQQERFADKSEYERLRNVYTLKAAHLKGKRRW